jgi:Spy/CpxP family protein refolding chaperone
MKTSRKNKQVLMLLMMFILGSSVSVMSQAYNKGRGADRNPGERPQLCPNIPDLTEAQETKLDKFRTAHLKEMTTFKNELKIKKAELRLLQTADKVDAKAVDAKIDEITNLKNKMMKATASHREDVRGVLTDEQRVYFDAHAGRGNGTRGHRPGGRGHGNGAGQGNYPDCPRR